MVAKFTNDETAEARRAIRSRAEGLTSIYKLKNGSAIHAARGGNIGLKLYKVLDDDKQPRYWGAYWDGSQFVEKYAGNGQKNLTILARDLSELLVERYPEAALKEVVKRGARGSYKPSKKHNARAIMYKRQAIAKLEKEIKELKELKSKL
jgi:hypothetical protein